MTPETKAFLDQVRDAEDPSPDTEQRVLRAVQATIAVSAAGATPSAAASTKLRSVTKGAVVKAGAVGLVLLGASMALVPWRNVEPMRSRETSPPVSAPRVEAPSQGLPSRAEPRPTSHDAVERVRPPAPEPTPRAMPSDVRAPSQVRAGTSPSQTSGLRAELMLLAEVSAALQRGDGATALRKLDEHVTSDGQLLSERQVARVLALCALNRTSEAQRAAADLLRQHPSSPHRAALAGTCAAQKTD